MYIPAITGQNFSYDDDVIEFFGRQGMNLGTTSWLLGTQQGTSRYPRHDMMAALCQLIHQAVHSTQDDKVAMVIVEPETAVKLFLCGILTADHLHDADEDTGVIDIPHVQVLDRTLTVRILNQPIPRLALATQKGEILHYLT